MKSIQKLFGFLARQTPAFVLSNQHVPDYRGGYVRLVDGQNEAEKAAMMRAALA